MKKVKGLRKKKTTQTPHRRKCLPRLVIAALCIPRHAGLSTLGVMRAVAHAGALFLLECLGSPMSLNSDCTFPASKSCWAAKWGEVLCQIGGHVGGSGQGEKGN